MIFQSFRTEIFRPEGVGTGTFLIAPFDPKDVFGKARAPVKVTITTPSGGHTFSTTIAIYGGRAYIGLNADVRKKTGAKEGDVVDVVVVLDTDERVIEAPPDLQIELDLDADAQAGWNRLSFTHQKEHVNALDEAKKAETRATRLLACLAMLKAK